MFKFACDFMLGRLARYLRICGFDTFYERFVDDDRLVYIGQSEDRYLLSRDRELMKRQSVKGLLIKSLDYKRQLLEVFEYFNITKSDIRLFTRCSKCNSLLVDISADISNFSFKIPPYVYATHNRFLYCKSCDKVYWAGSHYQGIIKTLSDIGIM